MSEIAQSDAPLTPPDASINSPKEETNSIYYLDERIKVLEKDWDSLNKRQSWQEQIHRNILPNGNVTHRYNIVPTMIISGLTGLLVALVVVKTISKINKK